MKAPIASSFLIFSCTETPLREKKTTVMVTLKGEVM